MDGKPGGSGSFGDRHGLRLALLIAAGISVLAVLYVISRENYLLFHGIAELFSSVVAFTIFILAWHTRKYAANDYLLLLGIAYLFVGAVDLLHMLAYSGMGVFPGYGTNLATQLWVIARYIEAFSLLVAPLFLASRLRVWASFSVYGLISFLALASVFWWDIFPTCYVEGTGLTPFKRISEYVISFILVLAIAFLFRRRDRLDTALFRLVVASIALTVVSELCFTLYVDPYGFFNLLGHYLKIVSFYLIYLAIVESGLERPYGVLFRELRESERRFRELVESAPVSVVIVQDGRIRYANPRNVEMIGYTLEEQAAGDPLDFVFEEDREMVARRISDALGGERATGQFQLRIVNKRGESRWWEISTAVIEYEGKPAVVGIGSDITDLMQMEQALRESEEKYRRMIEVAQEGIWTIDEGAVTTYVNRRMAEMLGYTEEEMLGRHLFDFMDEEGRKIAEANIERRRTGISEQHDFEFLRKDGERIYAILETTPLVDEDGAFRGAIAYVADITERRRAEKALQWEMEVNRALADVAGAMLSKTEIDEISCVTLENARRLTDSPFGYVGYIDTSTGYLICPTMTRDIWEALGVEGKDVVFKDFAGLWGWVIRERKALLSNQPTRDPRFPGTPEGHIPIERFISVPAMVEDALVGQIALVNSERDYESRDLAFLERLADLYAIAVLGMWSERELEGYREHLEEQVRERTGELMEANIRLHREVEARKEREEELRVTAAQLRALTVHLESWREDERRRIAREVHDRLGQELTGLKMDLSLMARHLPEEEGKYQERIGNLARLVDGIIQSVREISLELRPGILDDLGLAAALEWQMENFGAKAGLETDFVSMLDDDHIDPDLGITLFRISQEALTNVSRHAEARRVHMELSESGGEITLVISDDGKGIGARAFEAGSFGLLGMRERAHAYGGDVEISGAEGSGTRVTVRIPFAATMESGMDYDDTEEAVDDQGPDR